MREFGPRRELHDVLAHEHARLLLGAIPVVGVVVPVEVGLGSGRKELEKPLLALRQGVEPSHHEAARPVERERPLADALGGGTLHHAVVGDAQCGEPLAEAAVDRAERPPDGQETALLLREVGLLAERRPEGDDPQLGRRQVGYIGLDLLDILDVAEEHRGVDQVFVHRVEVREQHVAPEVEPVERLVVVLRIDTVELGDQPQAVTAPQARDLGHQVVDGHPFGLPHRPVCDPCEGIDEKEPGAPRRKEHGTLGKGLAIAGIKISGDFAQKGLHHPMVRLGAGPDAPQDAAKEPHAAGSRGSGQGRPYSSWAMLPPMNFSSVRTTAGLPL